METDTWKYKQPNLCWSSVRDNKRDVKQGVIKSRVLTGTYKTQHIISRYNKSTTSSICRLCQIRVITKLLNSEQSYKGKVKTHKYINRQNQSTTGKL
jgi:hypothetical protein